MVGLWVGVLVGCCLADDVWYYSESQETAGIVLWVCWFVQVVSNAERSSFWIQKQKLAFHWSIPIPIRMLSHPPKHQNNTKTTLNRIFKWPYLNEYCTNLDDLRCYRLLIVCCRRRHCQLVVLIWIFIAKTQFRPYPWLDHGGKLWGAYLNQFLPNSHDQSMDRRRVVLTRQCKRVDTRMTITTREWC